MIRNKMPWGIILFIIVISIYPLKKYGILDQTKLFFNERFLSYFRANAKEDKLLCIPNGEIRDYNTSINKYVAERFQQSTWDLIISINEKKLTEHHDNSKVEYSRVPINSDPNTYLMRFQFEMGDTEKRRYNIGYFFHSKSGRLTHFKGGGQFGIDSDIRTETYYMCSKFVESIF